MKRDDFEKELNRQPWRKPPGNWKEEILRQASEASCPPIKRVHFLEAFRWRELLWPHPAAWAGLAAVWMTVLAFHWTAPDTHRAAPMVSSDTPAEPAPDLELALSEQRKLKNELLGMTDNRDDLSQKSNKPDEARPRSGVAPNRAAA